MVVIITGGAGFIGIHTTRKMASDYEVIIIDNLYSACKYRIREIEKFSMHSVRLVKSDISDWSELINAISQLVRPGDVTGIIHLAAIVSIPEVQEKPQLAIDTNVKGTLNILELARRLDIERIVYASSVAVYGEPKYLPIDESHPLEPANLYGETKLMGERLLWRYMNDYGLKPIALRYFNVYGPGMCGGQYAGVVYRFITALLRGDIPIIYGDGNQTRDFIYVEDVAEANIKALESKYIGAVNIGSGREVSINELYKMICNIIGYCPEPRRLPPRPGDVKRSRAAVMRAQEKLNWVPRVSLYEGLEKSIKYYQLISRNYSEDL